MRWSGMVEWNEHLACNDFAAVQSGLSTRPCFMEVSFAVSRHCHLPLGDRISIVHLAEEDTNDLVNGHSRDARDNWVDNGALSFLTYHDHSKCGRVRAGPSCREATELAFSRKAV